MLVTCGRSTRKRGKLIDDGKRQLVSDNERKYVRIRPRLTLHQPRSSEGYLSISFANCLEQPNGKETWHAWLNFVPARIGSDPSLDLAARAFTEMQIYTSNGNVTLRKTSIRHYVEALQSLRSTLKMESVGAVDTKLLNVAILALYESTVGASLSSMWSHTNAIGLLLQAAPHTDNVSDIARAFIYYKMTTFMFPCALGIPSPFDTPYFLEIDPPTGQQSSNAVLNLRKLSHKLFIRLPKLIALVRELRNDTKPRAEDCVVLANELSLVESKESENELLHLVSVHKTKDSSSAFIIPFSFGFKTFHDFETAVYYWTTRAILTRLCMKLHHLCPGQANFDLPCLQGDLSRIAANLLMAGDFAFTLGTFGAHGGAPGATTFAVPSAVLWGVAMDIDKFRGLPSATVRRWAKQRFQDLMGEFKQFSDRDMNEMADLLVGGPLVGFVPRILTSLKASQD